MKAEDLDLIFNDEKEDVLHLFDSSKSITDDLIKLLTTYNYRLIETKNYYRFELDLSETNTVTSDYTSLFNFLEANPNCEYFETDRYNYYGCTLYIIIGKEVNFDKAFAEINRIRRLEKLNNSKILWQ